MFCWHKWSKWKDKGKTRHYEVVPDTGEKITQSYGVAQERRCAKCNKLQLREVKYL